VSSGTIRLYERSLNILNQCIGIDISIALGKAMELSFEMCSQGDALGSG
jgi:hypothetical protein